MIRVRPFLKTVGVVVRSLDGGVMGLISNLFSGGAKQLADAAGGLVDRFITTDDEKAAFKLKMQELIQKRDSEMEQTLRKELEAKERILVAELNQGDQFTKRARPSVVYAGLLFIFINYVGFPLLARIAQAFGLAVDATPLADLPPEFWVAWGGICATWSIGRSFEKRGKQTPVTRIVTGSGAPPTLLD